MEGKIEQVVDLFLENLERVNKNDQIETISTLKAIVHGYVNTQDKIKKILEPRVEKIALYLLFNRGAMGIRVSTYFAIFQPKRYASTSLQVASYLETKLA